LAKALRRHCAAFLSGSCVVTAFNHVGYHDLEDKARPAGHPDASPSRSPATPPTSPRSRPDRQAWFDPVVAGPLSKASTFEPGTELFGADVDEVSARLDRFPNSERGQTVARPAAGPGASVLAPLTA
jgi:hypothetical protein